MKDHDIMMTVPRFRVFTRWMRPGLDLTVALGILVILLLVSPFGLAAESLDQPVSVDGVIRGLAMLQSCLYARRH